MGSIIFFALIWYLLIGRNKPKTYKKVKKTKNKWLPLAILIMVLSVAQPATWALWPLMTFAVPVYIVYKVIQAVSSKKTAETPNSSYTTRQERNESLNKSEQLPNAVSRRIRIVQKINSKYELALTEHQIQTIVDASYVSIEWERFVHSMTKEYASLHQWYRSQDDGWLRVYLRVFNTQVVSPDMQQQKQICIDSFHQIFQHANLVNYNTPAWDIRDINNQFMTNFDDTSFMLAWRFLEENGIHHELGSVKILNADDELEQLKQKYADEAHTAHTAAAAK